MDGVELRSVGRSGLQVSALGLGCNNFGRRLDAAGSTQVVHAALDAGVTLFDTADIYAEGVSEAILGAALQGRRDEVIIATKFGGARGASPYRRGGSRRWVRIAVEESLRRLRTEWIDLYQMHFPDPATPIEETLRALDDLVREGKVRYVGSSNFSGWQVADAAHTAERAGVTPFISAQNEYSLVERDAEAELLPACVRFGVSLIPYYPLAGGFLSGKYARGRPAPPGTRLALVPHMGERMLVERKFDIVERAEAFAQERGQTVLDVAVAWLLAQPRVVSVIAGAMSPEQVASNVAAASGRLSTEDVELLNRLAAA
ncbi:MAG: aldo/keto reductase [Candidatus Dormibacteraeota bacterium]|nr:aldo/keto reductase [Candidatus Dormibacteraeota bacterium]MBV9526698.1 aldo/keto reductase [Candidatus Dormibacteraeota bacterium]